MKMRYLSYKKTLLKMYYTMSYNMQCMSNICNIEYVSV